VSAGLAEDGSSQAAISKSLQEISEKAQLLVREEIELAKLEVTEKVTKLVKGAAVAIIAGVFAIFGLNLLLHGLSWLAFYVLPVPSQAVFWGFFLVAGVLFLLGGLAGFLASRFLKGGAPPTPEMAIEEGRKIKDTVKG
jgi:H+/Cl- antiporter ClcA